MEGRVDELAGGPGGLSLDGQTARPPARHVPFEVPNPAEAFGDQGLGGSERAPSAFAVHHDLAFRAELTEFLQAPGKFIDGYQDGARKMPPGELFPAANIE